MTCRTRRPLALSAVLSAGVLIAGLTSAPADAVPEATGEAGYYEVTLGGGRDATDLRSMGADISRVRDGKAEIVTDSKGASTLREEGFQVTRRAGLYPAGPQPSNRAEGTYYGGYHTPAAHSAHNAKVVKDHPDLARVHDIGDSYLKTTGKGGHDIEAVCVTRDAGNGCALDTSGKPKMVLHAQIHARELSSGELAYRWIDELVTSDDPEIATLRETRELWIVPMANPDGVDRVASNPEEPLPQRKNMNETAAGEDECGTSMSSQPGVDLNRNSDLAWDADEGQPCDQTFPGKSAASEPETKAIQGLLTKLLPDKKDDDYETPVKEGATGTFLTLHSYGNLLIHPYSFSDSVAAPDASKLKSLGDSMAKSNGYVVGTAGETLGYTAPGGTDDWSYGRLGVPGFTFEVGGDGGECGGFFPAYSCMDDFWAKNRGAFITAAQAADDPYGQKR